MHESNIAGLKTAPGVYTSDSVELFFAGGRRVLRRFALHRGEGRQIARGFHREGDMERREFIGSMGALGGFFAVGGLAGGCRTVCSDGPLAAAQKTFEGRFEHERLSLGYHEVKIGLEKPFSILHISDTHLCAAYDDELPYDRRWARFRNSVFGGKQEEALRDSLAWAKENADAVLHTGDLIDFQTQANFDLVRRYFGRAPDMFGCLGNHEFQRHKEGEPIRNTSEYNALSADELRRVYRFDPELQSTVLGGVNFVAIEQVYGFVTASQVERFHAEARKGLPIVLCMHAPIMTESIWRANSKFWPGCGKKYRADTVAAVRGDYKRQLEDKTTADFVAYLKREPLLKAVLAGHLHIAVQDRLSPTAVEYVTGPNFLFAGQEILFS